MSKLAIGQPAPELQVQHWVQGDPVSISGLRGSVVLVEVFQVNCPGCFLHALPEAIRLHERYGNKGLHVIGLATAFEDFDKNTLDNLRLLVETGEVIGDPLDQLGENHLLDGRRLDYRLPFTVGMDTLVENTAEITHAGVEAFIVSQLPDYTGWPQGRRTRVYEKARIYLEAKAYCAKTFETYGLQGTPSSILIDRDGRLLDVSFGWTNHLEPIIMKSLGAN